MSVQREDVDIKLIAIDMDGTLLNDEQLISDENRKAIREAEDKGVCGDQHVPDADDVPGTGGIAKAVILSNHGKRQ